MKIRFTLRTLALCSTALQTAALSAVGLSVSPASAVAQLSPNAHPMGGQVVAGSAAITQNATGTVINQSSNRAAIDWQSFNVGSQQSVRFQQPSAASMTLNRVQGPDPSAIAGKISANGGVIITNPSGVVFYKGSQVDAQSLVASAPGITNQNFMAGKLVFDQASKPGAVVENRGTITVGAAGLAALVAPQVRNSGVINAHLAHAVLAGGDAVTLDMYGDELVSIDVTKQVVSTGDHRHTALVTNSGAIIADGGTVQITASAADGVVQDLVNAGGTIRADTVGNRTGRITINDTGGSVVIDGQLTATGIRPGTKGGTIQIAGTRNVDVRAGARIDASGQAGGGIVALGITADRAASSASNGSSATSAALSQTVTIAKRATIAADATASGNGGRISILSKNVTKVSGTISAQGKKTGNGGQAEISSEGQLGLDGAIDLSGGASGARGHLLLDPANLTITAATPGAADGTLPDNGSAPTTGADTISASAIEGANADITLQATNSIDVQAGFDIGSYNLTLSTGGLLTVENGISINAGAITLIGGASTPAGAIAGQYAASNLQGLGGLRLGDGSNLTALSTLSLSAGAQGAQLSGTLRAGGPITVDSGGALNITSTVTSSPFPNACYVGSSVTLNATGNVNISGGGITSSGALAIGAANGDLTMSASAQAAGPITLHASHNLTVSGALNSTSGTFNCGIVQGVTLTAGGDADISGPGITTVGALVIAAMGGAAAGNVDITAPLNGSDNVSLLASGTLTLGNTVHAGTGKALRIAANNVIWPSSSTAGTLSAQSGTIEIAPFSSQDLSLASPIFLDPAGVPNQVTIGATTIDYENRYGVLSPENITANNLSIGTATLFDQPIPGTLMLEATGAITETSPITGFGTLTGKASTVSLTGANAIPTLGSFTTTGAGGLVFNDTLPLTVTGPLTTSTQSNLTLSSAGPITIAGDISTRDLTLHAGGNGDGAQPILQTAGTVTAEKLSAFGSRIKLNEQNRIKSLDNITATSTLSFLTTTPLAIANGLSAGNFNITAATISLLDGMITYGATGGDDRFTVTGGGAFVQTGNTTFAVTGNGGSAVDIDLRSGGRESFANLNAGHSHLVLDLGAGGTATGNLTVKALTVNGQGGSSALNGSVAGLSGTAAAIMDGSATIDPEHYKFNDCGIGAGCSVPGGGDHVDHGHRTTQTFIVTPNVLNAARAVSSAPASAITAGLADPVQDVARNKTVGLSGHIDIPAISPDDLEPILVIPNVSNQDY